MPNLRELTIEDAAYALDGGSIYLALSDKAGGSHALLLVQHRIPMASNDFRLPGRLYLDNRIIAVRSDEEFHLLSEIKVCLYIAHQSRSPGANGANRSRSCGERRYC